MKLRKTTNELSVEELLKALEESNVAEQKPQEIINSTLPVVNFEEFNDTVPIASFIHAFNLKDGKHLISHIPLFTLYKLWNKGSGTTVDEFTREMNYFFISERRRSGSVFRTYYRLNENALKLIKYIDHYRKDSKRKYRTNKNYKKYFEKFFADIGITGGDLYIEADVLYHVYDTYMYKRNRKSYAYHSFELVCTLLFETKYFTDFTLPWFGVSENIKQLISEEAVANWRKGRKLRGRKTKEVKTKGNKIIYPKTKED
jgi:hypothetical protein